MVDNLLSCRRCGALSGGCLRYLLLAGCLSGSVAFVAVAAVDDLHGLVATVETKINGGGAVVTEPENFLPEVGWQAPALRIVHAKYRKPAFAEALEFSVAFGIRAGAHIGKPGHDNSRMPKPVAARCGSGGDFSIRRRRVRL